MQKINLILDRYPAVFSTILPRFFSTIYQVMTLQSNFISTVIKYAVK